MKDTADEGKSSSSSSLLCPPAGSRTSYLHCDSCCTAAILSNSCAVDAVDKKYLRSFSVGVAKEWEHNRDITDQPDHPQKLPHFQHRTSVPSKAEVSDWEGFPVPAAGKYREKSLYCHIWTAGTEPKLKLIFLTY